MVKQKQIFVSVLESGVTINHFSSTRISLTYFSVRSGNDSDLRNERESQWVSFALISSLYSLSVGWLTGKERAEEGGGSGESVPVHFRCPQPCPYFWSLSRDKNVTKTRCQTGPQHRHVLWCCWCYSLLIRRYNKISPFCPNHLKPAWWWPLWPLDS